MMDMIKIVSMVSSSAKAIVTAIEKSTRLVSLRLEGNTMGVEAASLIGKALEKHKEFEVP